MKLYTKLFTKQQTKCLNKYSKSGKAGRRGLALKVRKPLLVLPALLFFSSLLSSCSRQTNTFTIWTSRVEFASYVEYYNASHENSKAVLVYKEDPFHSLSSARGDSTPDLIISDGLKNSATKRYFHPLDNIIREGGKGDKIDYSIFYKTLYEYGTLGSKTYLLPVSFNLPMLAFGNANESVVGDSHLIGMDLLKSTSGEFNARNNSDDFTAMGYGVSWNPELLYEFTKIRGGEYREKGKYFQWNKNALASCIEEFKKWTTENNQSTTNELNFQFKYLFTPGYKQVVGGRCLYTFYTSDNFFKFKPDQVENLSYRWLGENGKIPVEDNIVMAGIYKKAKNVKRAEDFIIWFMKEQTQKELMERSQNMNLNTRSFGISGGFSSIRSVNETILPIYYRTLLENLPSEENLTLPDILPPNWGAQKENILYPYLLEMVQTDRDPNFPEPLTLEQRIQSWNKSNL